MIEEGSLEKLEDFEYQGKKVLASRLGYRMTSGFLFRYFNRIFNEPGTVFNERMLKPELQDMESYVDGINNIVEAQRKVALNYFEDGSIEAAIPPLKVLLHIMAHGHFEGKEISDHQLRSMFNRDNVIAWLKLLGSKEGSDAFNPLKGSISARTDTNLAKYNDYAKSASADFGQNRIIGSLAHGVTANEGFMNDFASVMEMFLKSRNAEAAAKAAQQIAVKNGISK